MRIAYSTQILKGWKCRLPSLSSLKSVLQKDVVGGFSVKEEEGNYNSCSSIFGEVGRKNL